MYRFVNSSVDLRKMCKVDDESWLLSVMLLLLSDECENDERDEVKAQGNHPIFYTHLRITIPLKTHQN